MADTNNDFWVRIESLRAPKDRRVIFNTMPSVTESGGVQYSALTPVHLPGNYHVYENTSSRTYEIGDLKLVSRNQQEARENLLRINTLRAWRMPYFGSIAAVGSTIAESQAVELRDYLGAPPEVLLLSAYSSTSKLGNIYKIPTVLTNLTITYPNDVEYIPTAMQGGPDDKLGGVPFPVLMSVSVSLTEQHSADDFERFNLIGFRTGQLTNF